MLARMTRPDTHLTELFTEFVQTTSRRAPLYSAISALCAPAQWCHDLMAQAPVEQRRPVLWLAAVHFVCRRYPNDPLAAFMPTVTMHPRPPEELRAQDLEEFAERHREALNEVISTRRTQTNEVGRSAVFMPVLAQVFHEVRSPLALLDVGSSAGLNLLFDQFGYAYDPGPHLEGAPQAPVVHCGTRGAPPLPLAVPPVTARRGVDIAPIDVTQQHEADWLRACVWADQIGRARLLEAALDLACATPPEVHHGDASVDLPVHLEALAPHGHTVVLTSWVLSYLSPPQRAAFLRACDNWGAHHDLTWVALEAPQDLAPLQVRVVDDRSSLTHIVTRTWRKGEVHQQTWGISHPHGYWMHWAPEAD